MEKTKRILTITKSAYALQIQDGLPSPDYQWAPSIESRGTSFSTSITGSLPCAGWIYLTDPGNNTYFISTGTVMCTDDQGVPGKCLSVCESEVRLPLRATFFSKEVVYL